MSNQQIPASTIQQTQPQPPKTWAQQHTALLVTLGVIWFLVTVACIVASAATWFYLLNR